VDCHDGGAIVFGIQSFLINLALGTARRLPIHVQGYLLVLDEEGKESQAQIKFNQNADLGVVRSFMQEFAQKVDAIIKGQVVGAGFSLEVTLSGLGLKTAPVSGADVEEKVKLYMKSQSDLLTTTSLPAIDEAFILPDGTLDLTDATVAALVALIQSGKTVGANNVTPSDINGLNITNVLAGGETFRR